MLCLLPGWCGCSSMQAQTYHDPLGVYARQEMSSTSSTARRWLSRAITSVPVGGQVVTGRAPAPAGGYSPHGLWLWYSDALLPACPSANNHVSWRTAERRVWCSPPVCDRSFSSPCLLIISFSPSLRLSVSPSASLLLFIFPLYHNQGPGPLPTLLRALFPSLLLPISPSLLPSFPPSLCLFFCISSSLHLSTVS